MKSRSPLSRENSTKCLALKDMDMMLPMIQTYNINNQQSSKHASHNEYIPICFLLYFRYLYLSWRLFLGLCHQDKSVLAPESTA